jgi:beta-glucanase (GH16 family)
MDYGICMKKIIFTLLLMIAAKPVFAGWETHWIDKFDRTSVNYNIWTAEIQADYTGTEECYTDDETPQTGNLEVSNGTLKITARKGDINCPGLGGKPKTWTSGRLNSKDKAEFLYGRIEARLKFSNLESGLWPAFWALEGRISEPPIKGDDDNVPWPNPGAGEIDIWEWMAQYPSTYFNAFHNIEGDNPTNPKCGKTRAPALPGGATDIQQWHTYAMEWTKTSINFYMDENLMSFNDVSECAQYKEPMFALINIQIGNAGGPIDPKLDNATMEIDYVAHCLATETNNFTGCNESTPAQQDDDSDGVRNLDDLCLSTPANAVIDINGCAANETAINVAPEVTLKITQNGVNVKNIATNAGTVVLTATVSDRNLSDTHTYAWTLNGLTGVTQNANTISFDPGTLDAVTHSISVEAIDNGTPSLSGTTDISFMVTKITKTEPTKKSKSGGSVDFYLLLLLAFFVANERFIRAKARKPIFVRRF